MFKMKEREEFGWLPVCLLGELAKCCPVAERWDAGSMAETRVRSEGQRFKGHHELCYQDKEDQKRARSYVKIMDLVWTT